MFHQRFAEGWNLDVLNGMNEFNLYSSRNPYFMDPESLEKRKAFLPVSDKESNVFFLNEGGKLKNVSQASGLDFAGNSRSAVYVDIDGDGDLDMPRAAQVCPLVWCASQDL